MFIKKSMFHRTLIFILVFTILFNFITIPKKVNAEVLTMSYGFYIFLKAAYAAGLTYIVADRVTEDGMRLYQEWKKFNENKPDPPDDNDQKNAIANLLGLGLVDSFGNLVDSVKDFFKSLGAKEGDNIIENDLIIDLENNIGFRNPITINNYRFDPFSDSKKLISIFKFDNFIYEVFFVKNVVTFSINGIPSADSIKIPISSSRLDKSFSYYVNLELYGTSFGSYYNLGYVVDSHYINKKGVDSQIKYQYGSTDRAVLKNDLVPYVPVYSIDIFYNITRNSYILTDDKKDVKKMSPNIDILPKEKLETITTPEGDYQKYIGDDLVDDYIQSIPNFPGNVFETIPGSFVDTDYGIIWVPEGSPVPSPNPNPEPEPEPEPEPNPEPNPGEDPYPEIIEEDVEIPKGLGKIIALLKELVNWSSRIFNKEEIDKEPDKPGLFEIPADLELDLDPLKNLAIVEKFPFSLPWDLKNAVNLLVSPGEPPSWEVPIFNEKITIDLAEFESLAGISRSFFTVLFIISLVIATRRFIGGA